MKYLFSQDLIFSLQTNVVYSRHIEHYSETEDLGLQIDLDGANAPLTYLLELPKLSANSQILVTGSLAHDVEVFYGAQLTKIFYLNFDIKLNGHRLTFNLNGDTLVIEGPEQERYRDEKFLVFTDPNDLSSAGGAVDNWFAGEGLPGVGLGSNGAYYLDLSTNDYYKKLAGVWVFQRNLAMLPTLTGRMMNKQVTVGYRLWIELEDPAYFYIAEAAAGAVAGDAGAFRGIRIAKTAEGAPTAEIEENTAFKWSDKSGGVWS